MFSPSRDEARRHFFDTWRKYRAGEALSDLEQVTLRVISMHTGYHPLLDNPQHHLDHDYPPEDGGLNPFLHLSLHLAVEEQLSIDQPQGIRAHFERIAQAAGSEHDAKHALLECLAETIWQAQRTNTAPDQTLYVACMEKKFRK